jgi:hypothetical protein
MTAGITGHQDLGSQEAEKWTAIQIEKWLSAHPISVGYSSLAVGADQLFAECVLTHGTSLCAIVPCNEYESTFRDEAGLANFRRLLQQASSTVQLPYRNPTEEAFWAAGRWIVDHADVLLAVWDGKPAKGLGGTGDVVAYANTRNKFVWQINPVERMARQRPK